MGNKFNVTGNKFDFQITPNSNEWYIKPFTIQSVNGVIHITRKAQKDDIEPKTQTFRIYKGHFIKTVFNLFCTEKEAEKHPFTFSDMVAALNANHESVRQLYLDAVWNFREQTA